MNDDPYILIKGWLNDDLVNYARSFLYTKQAIKSPISLNGSVNPNAKRRDDIFLDKHDALPLDNHLFTNACPIILDKFGINIQYKERYKIGSYYGDQQGFHHLHTDIQGSHGIMRHRKISSVVCLSHQTDYEGGILKFPKLNQAFKLDRGDAIFFRSSLLHGVDPVTKGRRDVLISFLFDVAGAKLKRRFTKDIDQYISLAHNKIL